MPGLISLLLLGASPLLPAEIHLEVPALSLPALAEELDFRPHAPAWGTEEQRVPTPRWLRLATAGVLEPVAATVAAGFGYALSVLPVLLVGGFAMSVEAEGAWVGPAVVVAALPILVVPGLLAAGVVLVLSESVAGIHASPWATMGGGVAGNLAALALLFVTGPDLRLFLLPAGGAVLGANLSAAFMDQAADPLHPPVPLHDEPPGPWLPLAAGQF